MVVQYEAGQIVEGKVTGIQSYGAFVALDDETQGLVHISEVTHGFVKDINEHLAVGDVVNVKVIQVDEDKNKISLSIRATIEAPKKENTHPAKRKQQPRVQEQDNAGFNTMKDKLEEWMKQSNK